MTLFPWKRALRSKRVWFSLWVLLIFGLIAALAPWISPQDPYRWGMRQANLPPAWMNDPANPGKAEYLLGTDFYGRDILSRLIYGTRTAFLLVLTAVPLAALVGTLLGLISGYAGGRVDAWIMRFTDTMNALPGIMLLVIIVLIFRSLLSPTWLNGLITLVAGYAAVSWVSLTRLVRVNVLRIKSQLFVEAAVALGASPRFIMMQHLFPNVLHVVLVWMIINIPTVILLEALLGYVGVGLTSAVDGSEFTVVSWGGLFFSGRSAMIRNPWMLAIPSLCILLVSMSFILLGDFLNEINRNESSY